MEQLSNDELTARLVEILQIGPLYRELLYAGAAIATLPNQLRLLCPGCGTEQMWRVAPVSSSHVNNDKIGVGMKRYSCRNCNKCQINYLFRWHAIDNKESIFQKIGQYPPLDETLKPQLEKALGKDLKLYKNAIRLRNFNLGLGAVSYMRRIVENHMNEILDTLYEAAKTSQTDSALLNDLEKAKTSYRFDDKVEYAAKLMPLHLRPPGLPNPLDVLHDVSSDGLHARSEDECVDIFDRCQMTFEYLFASLRPQLDDTRAYKDSLLELSKLRNLRKNAAHGAQPNKKDPEQP